MRARLHRLEEAKAEMESLDPERSSGKYNAAHDAYREAKAKYQHFQSMEREAAGA